MEPWIVSEIIRRRDDARRGAREAHALGLRLTRFLARVAGLLERRYPPVD